MASCRDDVIMIDENLEAKSQPCQATQKSMLNFN
jgi:hypothetical protein